MKIFTFIVIFALTAKMTFPQTGWLTAGIPGIYSTVECIFNDSISDKLYFGGTILNPSFSSLAITCYDGSNWNVIGNANNRRLSIMRYNNIIIASGLFTKVGGVDVNYIGKYDGTTWSEFGNFNAQVLKVKIINNELYAMGVFTMVDSILCNGIAQWNGTSWQPVFSFPFIGAYVFDAEFFQGNLYVGGNSFDIGTTDYNDIAVYKNGNWQMVGNGIQGFASAVDKMLVYKNELIVAGLIWRKAGNTGDGIQKWNGTSWSDLGMGLRNGTNPNTSQPHVHDIKIYNDELYVAGLFDYVDSLYSKHLAKWDGDKWCNFPTQDFIATNLVVDIYHDTIYTGCGYDTLNGDTINYLAKMLSLQPTACRVTGIEESLPTATPSTPLVIPNPANETITILNTVQNTIITITNITGQTIIQTTLYQINISHLISGIYFIQAQSKNNIQTTKFIKQ